MFKANLLTALVKKLCADTKKNMPDRAVKSQDGRNLHKVLARKR